MKPKKKVANAYLIALSLLNLVGLVYGIQSYPQWIIIAFLAALVQLAFLTLYLQYYVNPARVIKQHNSTYNRIDALFSIHKVIDIRMPLPIMHHTWTISSDYGLALTQHVLTKPSGDVLDIGSGISTLLAGYAIEKRGSGKVIALEHEEHHFNKLKALIAHHSLEKYVSLYYCPLISHVIDGKQWLWYDISSVESLTGVNLVSIDGPPGKKQSLARYPALPLLRKHIAAHAEFLMDDAARKDEQQIAHQWEIEFGLEAQYTPNTKGMFLLKPKSV